MLRLTWRRRYYTRPAASHHSDALQLLLLVVVVLSRPGDARWWLVVVDSPYLCWCGRGRWRRSGMPALSCWYHSPRPLSVGGRRARMGGLWWLPRLPSVWRWWRRLWLTARWSTVDKWGRCPSNAASVRNCITIHITLDTHSFALSATVTARRRHCTV